MTKKNITSIPGVSNNVIVSERHLAAPIVLMISFGKYSLDNTIWTVLVNPRHCFLLQGCHIVILRIDAEYSAVSTFFYNFVAASLMVVSLAELLHEISIPERCYTVKIKFKHFCNERAIINLDLFQKQVI